MQTAQKQMQENLHSRIEDILQNATRMGKQQDRVSNRQAEQESRLEELERTGI